MQCVGCIKKKALFVSNQIIFLLKQGVENRGETEEIAFVLGSLVYVVPSWCLHKTLKNNTKTSLPFSLSFSQECKWGFPEATGCVISRD